MYYVNLVLIFINIDCFFNKQITHSSCFITGHDPAMVGCSPSGGCGWWELIGLHHVCEGGTEMQCPLAAWS